MSKTEADECVMSIKSKVNNSNVYSELYGNVHWVRDWTPRSTVHPLGTTLIPNLVSGLVEGNWHFKPKWTKNGLNLTFEERWVGSTKIIDIKFRNPKPKGTIHGLQNVNVKRR